MCASVHCTSNIPDLAIKGLADGDCSGDVIIPRPRHHNLCVALTCIAVLHLHRQTHIVCCRHKCFLVLAAVLKAMETKY